MVAVMIGVDPHKGSHTAVVISPAEEPLGEIRVRASAAQAGKLAAWAAAWPERTWAVEGAAGLGRAELAAEFPGDMRHLDAQLRGTRKKLAAAVKVCGTTLTQVFGVGPVIAGTIIGDIADVSRFPGRDHFASCNGTAPVEVSSGNRKIHRLSLRGNRRINYAIHMAAITQIRHKHSDGRACYDKKIAEGKTHKAALRSLKRRISDAIYACLLADARRAGQIPPARTAREGNRVTTLTPARPAHTPSAGSSDKPLPDLGTTIRPGTTAATPSPPKPTSRKTLTTT